MRGASALLPLLPYLLVGTSVHAQGQWAATLTMSRKAIAVGECNVVALDLRDAATKDWPRGPNGTRVSMADFDLRVTATAAHAAVGQYDGPNSFAVCACPKAPAGTVATVTATYPSQTIAPKMKVSDVSFATTVSAPIVAGASSGNPPGCEVEGATTVASTGRARPWTVTVQPPMSLPIGSCAGVLLTLRDSSGKDWPRTPAGTRVTLADFDFTVAAAGGSDVVGKYDGASSFAACACQSGTVGERATVTATYPARALTAKAEVPGVALTATAPFTLAAARGAANPAGCGEKQQQVIASAVARGGAVRASPMITTQPTQAAGASPTALTIRDAPPALEGPIASAPRTGGVIPPAAPAPTGVTMLASPRIARLSWTAAPNATRYAVWRGNGAAVSIERTPPAFRATQFADTVPDAHETYRYAVIAYYSDGRQGEAPAVQFTSPPMTNPSGFTAVASGVPGGGGVTFQWQAVPGAARYRIDGPGLPATGYFAIGTSAGHPHMPGGPGTWRLQTMYPGNIGDSAGASTASLMLHVLPPRSKQWLTKNNGAGVLSQVQTPGQQVFNDVVGGSPIGNFAGDLMPAYDAAYASWLGQSMHWHLVFSPSQNPNAQTCHVPDDMYRSCVIPGLKVWLNLFFSPLWDDPEQAANEAVYGNPGDLGVGRRAFCYQSDSVAYRGQPGTDILGPYTVCYATAHGVPPGQAGFNDPQTITHPGEGLSDDFILSMVIVKDPNGTTFLVLGKNGKYPLLSSVRLDSEGPKLVPFACIACHGGTYNASTRKVDGSSFLPLDPNLLSFASPSDQAAQEEKIRNINFMIRKAQPQSAIAQYLNGLYHGAIGTPGTTAVPDYVPTSWASQAGFYRSVVRSNCTMCHLAAPESWNFASWQNFQDNSALIYADVCLQHTMPHAEVPFKSFWLKDTGILYLPGLLAATLGKPSC